MRRALQDVGLLCGHGTRRVMVHAVEGGHRAHCLRCGALGKVRESPEAALGAISPRRTPGEAVHGRNPAPQEGW
jgi:hypothetical protein